MGRLEDSGTAGDDHKRFQLHLSNCHADFQLLANNPEPRCRGHELQLADDWCCDHFLSRLLFCLGSEDVRRSVDRNQSRLRLDWKVLHRSYAPGVSDR